MPMASNIYWVPFMSISDLSLEPLPDLEEDINYLHFNLSLYFLVDEFHLSSLSLNRQKALAGGGGGWQCIS